MRQLFREDPGRFETFSAKAGDLLLDYSKNRIDEAAMEALFDVARAAGVEERRDRMWAGEHINITEDRAVMHMALRYQGSEPVQVDGVDVMPQVRETLSRIEAFSDRVRDGTSRGHTGEPHAGAAGRNGRSRRGHEGGMTEYFGLRRTRVIDGAGSAALATRS